MKDFVLPKWTSRSFTKSAPVFVDVLVLTKYFSSWRNLRGVICVGRGQQSSDTLLFLCLPLSLLKSCFDNIVIQDFLSAYF